MSTHYVSYQKVVKSTKTVSTTIELLHCPFCGGEAEFRQAHTHRPDGGGHGVRCKSCKVVTAIRQGSDGQIRAAALWNQRATP